MAENVSNSMYPNPMAARRMNRAEVRPVTEKLWEDVQAGTPTNADVMKAQLDRHGRPIMVKTVFSCGLELRGPA